MILYIHKRRSSAATGTVTDAHGLILGRVFAASKVAAGTHGQRRRFYTAEACYPGHPGIRMAPSLGTRYPSRAAAAEAVRSFALEYPRATLNEKADQLDFAPRSHWPSRINPVEWRYNRALSWAVSRWRTEHGVVGGKRFPASVVA
jgi:hypothetical protein